MISDVLLRLDLATIEPSRDTLQLPEGAPAPLIEDCFYELANTASSMEQIYDAADTTNRVFRLFPMQIQSVDILTYCGLPLCESRWGAPMVQLLFPADGSSRRAKSWDSEDISEFERVASLYLLFPERTLPVN